MSKLKDKLIKETSWSFALKACTFPLFFILNIFLARTLGVDKMGEWSFFFSIFTTLLLLSNFGIKASMKFIAQHNHTDNLIQVLNDATKLRVICISIFSAILLIFSDQLAILINRVEFTNLFRWAALLLLVTGFVEYLKHVFTGLHRIKYTFIVNVSELTLKVVFVILLLTWSLDLKNIIWAFTLAVTISVLAGFYLLYKNFYTKENTSTQKYFKEIFDYSIPLFLVSIGFSIATEVDTIMLGLLSTDAEVGVYAIAKQIVVKLPHFSYAVAMGTMPVFAKITMDNQLKLKRLFFRLLGVNALVFIPVVLGILFLGPYLIPLIYGAEYAAAVLPLQILTVYLLVFTFTVFFNQLLDYQGLAKIRAINIFISTTLNIVLNYYLIPKYGAVGAAISTSISYFPYLILNAWEARKLFPY